MTSRIFLFSALAVTLALVVLTALVTLAPIRGAPSGLPINDKGWHFIAFAALAFPVAVVRPRWWPGIFLALALYGGIIEIVQPYVGRGRELADWFADCAGALTGCLLGVLIHLLLRRRTVPAA